MKDSPELAALLHDLGGEWTIAVEHAFDGLPARQRSVVVLRYVQRLTIAEIARREGIADATVRDALARAQGRLRRALRQR